MSENYTVIEVISPMQVVLNCGDKDGIKKGEHFIIFGLGKVLSDPETGEELEQLEILRGEGKTIHVQEKICTVESTKTTEIPKSITRKSHFGLGQLAGPVEETEITRKKEPFEEVQIGDKARKK